MNEFEFQDCIRRTTENDISSLLVDENDPAKFYRSFRGRYDHHDAETMFPWAKGIMFHETSAADRVPKRLSWIKCT